MKTARLYNNEYWMGEKVNPYGLENGWIDYRCLARVVGDMVLCNDITKLFFCDLNGEYNEIEQENGYVDYYDEMNELREQIDEIQEQLDNMEIENDKDVNEYNRTQEQLDELQEQLDELENEQDNPPEIYQYYIISDQGARILKEYTDEIVYYIPVLDIYVWGVTHWGTSWDYVLTNIKIEEDKKNGCYKL